MGIKIYTYKDPFHLDKYSYWNEIKQYPHLCVSQTLVQGLDKKYIFVLLYIYYYIQKKILSIYIQQKKTSEEVFFCL